MRRRDSRRVIDSDILRSEWRKAFSSRMAARLSSFSLVSSWISCRVFLESYCTSYLVLQPRASHHRHDTTYKYSCPQVG